MQSNIKSELHDPDLQTRHLSRQQQGRGLIDLTITYGIAACYLGHALVACTDRGVCSIELADDPAVLSGRLAAGFKKLELKETNPESNQLFRDVIQVIEYPGTDITLPLDLRGTSFQQLVWQALQAIPVGQTRTYSELALAINRPRAVRAVANACAANKLAIAVPCHRVIRQDGSPGGYRWGVARKQQILAREKLFTK